MPLITQHHGVGFKGSKTMLGDLKFQSGKEIQEEPETHRQSHRKTARLELLNLCAASRLRVPTGIRCVGEGERAEHGEGTRPWKHHMLQMKEKKLSGVSCEVSVNGNGTHSFSEFKWLLAGSHDRPLWGTTKNYFPSRLGISFSGAKYMCTPGRHRHTDTHTKSTHLQK